MSVSCVKLGKEWEKDCKKAKWIIAVLIGIADCARSNWKEKCIRQDSDGSIARVTPYPRDYYCWWSCTHENGQSAAFHTCCYTAWAGNRVPNVGEVTRPNLIPLKGQVLTDTESTRAKITWSLKAKYNRLPAEICRYVAEYLVRDCHALATLSVEPNRPRSMEVTATREIWAQFTKIHGHVYISSLSNTQCHYSDNTTKSMLIYRLRQHSIFNTIYIAYHPWGTRNVLFASSGTNIAVREREGVWWHALELMPHIEAESDVSEPLLCTSTMDLRCSTLTGSEASPTYVLGCDIPAEKTGLRQSHADTCDLWIQSAYTSTSSRGAKLAHIVGITLVEPAIECQENLHIRWHESWNGGTPIDSARYTIKKSKH
ncbi:hypothetical protein IF2G_10842 [Cordyceps javanica]|nr:hypothetical protein IF2G_10842 [Cordyceps javanica]